MLNQNKVTKVFGEGKFNFTLIVTHRCFEKLRAVNGFNRLSVSVMNM
jgi:hypothetical protein